MSRRISNTGIGLDEARFLPAGVYHWLREGFEPANDSPPLARMIAALPLLPLGVNLPPGDPGARGVDASPNVLDNELWYGGRFVSSTVNFESYKLLCFARMTGFLWWLLGAWVIGKWSYGLWGATARYLALILWCICPNVVAFEQRVTPDLPLAVIWVAASYSLWRHLRAPSWDRALACGLVLGVSQLVDFASLALILVWALVALLHRSARPSQASAGITPSTRMLQVVSAIGLSVWCTNVGYGFIGSGARWGALTSSALHSTGARDITLRQWTPKQLVTASEAHGSDGSPRRYRPTTSKASIGGWPNGTRPLDRWGRRNGPWRRSATRS